MNALGETYTIGIWFYYQKWINVILFLLISGGMYFRYITIDVFYISFTVLGIFHVILWLLKNKENHHNDKAIERYLEKYNEDLSGGKAT